MRYVILFFICQCTFGQMSYDRLEYNFNSYTGAKIGLDIPESVKVIGVFVGSIVLDAIGDGLYDDGRKELGKLFQAASVASLLTLPFLIQDTDNWWYGILSYVCLRVAFFDPVYNLTRGLPIGYIGNTTYWDKGLNAFAPPPGIQLFGRSMFLIAGFKLTLEL